MRVLRIPKFDLIPEFASSYGFECRLTEDFPRENFYSIRLTDLPRIFILDESYKTYQNIFDSDVFFFNGDRLLDYDYSVNLKEHIVVVCSLLGDSPLIDNHIVLEKSEIRF